MWYEDKVILKENMFFYKKFIYYLLKYLGYIILELQAYLNDIFRIEQSLTKRNKFEIKAK